MDLSLSIIQRTRNIHGLSSGYSANLLLVTSVLVAFVVGCASATGLELRAANHYSVTVAAKVGKY